jgi:bla regulator protein BlaR1
VDDLCGVGIGGSICGRAHCRTLRTATGIVVVDDQGHVTALIHHRNGHDSTFPRIDSAEAEKIEATLAERIKKQIAMPGSEAALRRNIDGLRLGYPIYSEMSSDLQDATREQLPRLTEDMNRWGPVESVRFLGIGSQGWDIYQVTHASGSTIWRIHLVNNGIIDGTASARGPVNDSVWPPAIQRER